MRFLWPELPLLEPKAFENKGAFKGEEPSSPLGYWKSETLDEESDSMSPLEDGRLRRSSSSIFGSMMSRARSSSPSSP